MIQTAQESAIGLHSLLKMSEAVSSSLRIRDILGSSTSLPPPGRRARLSVVGGALDPGRQLPRRRRAAVGDLVPLGAEPSATERQAARRVLESGSELS